MQDTEFQEHVFATCYLVKVSTFGKDNTVSLYVCSVSCHVDKLVTTLPSGLPSQLVFIQLVRCASVLGIARKRF